MQPKIKSRIKQDWLWKFVTSLFSFKSRNVAFAISLMVIIGLTEGIGLLLLVPLLQLVGLDVQQGALGGIAAYISSFFSYLHIEPTLITILIIYVVIISLNAYFGKLQTTRSSQVQYEFAAHLRKRLFQAITKTRWLFFSSKRSSDFAHALTYEIERIANGTSQFLSIIASTIILVVYIILALQLSGLITGFIFLIGIVLLLLLRNRTQSASASGEKLSKTSKDMYSSTIKQMEGMKTIKSFNMEEKNVNMFQYVADDVSQKYRDAIKSYADVRFLFDVGSVVILSIIVFVLVGIMAIPTAELFILLFLFVRMIPRFSTIQRNYQYFINMLPAYKTVTELEKECLNAAEPEMKAEEMVFNDSIRLGNLNFSYGEDSFSIKNLNLTIKSGETTALVGLSGAGKSTIVDIVMGLIKPDDGEVLVDEIPLTPKYLSSWRNKIGYVAQETFLFNDTVKNNLLVAEPEADENMLMEALKQASADEFVLRLPDGLDTLVGDRGVLLSGGERQRLALARALIRKPNLLIMDEATSNLDSENETRILNAIEKLHGGITILMIAHRLSTIRKADLIYLIEKGKVIEEGSWNGLLQKEEGKFKGLYKRQS